RYQGGVLRFVPDPCPEPFQWNAPPPLRPVRWGRRLYFVPLTKTRKFCLQVARGDEPRTSRYNSTTEPAGWCDALLRDGDETKRARGLPGLDPRGQPYLRQLWRRYRGGRADARRLAREQRGSFRGSARSGR